MARVTHLSARAVVALPTASGCEATVTNTFTNDPTASWLLDSDNDGVLDVAVTTADGWPAATGEVNLAISWEDNPKRRHRESDSLGRRRRRKLRRHRAVGCAFAPAPRLALVRSVPGADAKRLNAHP